MPIGCRKWTQRKSINKPKYNKKLLCDKSGTSSYWGDGLTQ